MSTGIMFLKISVGSEILKYGHSLWHSNLSPKIYVKERITFAEKKSIQDRSC